MLRRRQSVSVPATAPRGALRPMLLAALAGAVTVFAFAPFGFWPLQLLSLGYLFYQLGRDSTPRHGMRIGFAYGFGWTVAGMHWLFISMHRYGDMPAPLAALAVCLFGAYIGLYSGAALALANWLRQRWSLPVAAFLLAVAPVAWVLAEWVRGWLLTGYPGGAIGYAHIASPLAGFAPVAGVLGTSLAAAVCAGALAMLTQRGRGKAFALLCVLMAAGFGLRQVNWTEAHGQPITVRLLQGNIAQQMKFDPQHLGQTIEQYRAMITAGRADLVAAPETALPILPQFLPAGYLDSLRDYAAANGSHLIIGMPVMVGPDAYANSVVGIAPQGAPYRYDKHHLMPFGEFIPAGFHWFVDLMQIPLGDLSSGAERQAPFAVRDQRVLPNICYEDLFGEEIAMQLRGPQAATMLLNVSNLAWFGESLAIDQHLQISRMRALETGRPMLRATNSGATAVIDPHGGVSSVLDFYTRGTLAATVQGMDGATPYIRFGNSLALLIAALALAGAWLAGRQYGKTQDQASQSA
jgi:apolipoprotein N-acyltransferase